MSYVKSVMLFLGLSVLLMGAYGNVVDFIDPCHINDSKCVLESSKKVMPHFVHGIKDLGVQAIEPILLSNVNADNGELKLGFQDMTVKGLSQCKLLKLERTEKLKATLVAECPIVANGHYKLDGKFAHLPIDGNGPCEISAENIRITVTITLSVIKGKNNEDHYKIIKFHYEYDPIGPVKFTLENLCGGDKVKSEPFDKILTDVASGKDLIRTFGKPVLEEIIKKCVSSINKLFSIVPCNELELS